MDFCLHMCRIEPNCDFTIFRSATNFTKIVIFRNSHNFCNFRKIHRKFGQNSLSYKSCENFDFFAIFIKFVVLVEPFNKFQLASLVLLMRCLR